MYEVIPGEATISARAFNQAGSAMKLTELMPWAKWVEFEREFNERSGWNSCIVDRQGLRITAYRKWANPLCPAIRGDPKGQAAICDKAEHRIREADHAEGRLTVTRCGAGLLVLAVPVYRQGKLLGFVGGCGLLPVDGKADTLAVSAATGLSMTKIKELCCDIKQLDKSEMEALGRHLQRRLNELLL